MSATHNICSLWIIYSLILFVVHGLWILPLVIFLIILFVLYLITLEEHESNSDDERRYRMVIVQSLTLNF